MQIELAIVLAVHGLVSYLTGTVVSTPWLSWTTWIGNFTFELAILADVGRLVRAFSSRVSLHIADAAGSLEHTRVGAFALGVAKRTSAHSFCIGNAKKGVSTLARHN